MTDLILSPKSIAIIIGGAIVIGALLLIYRDIKKSAAGTLKQTIDQAELGAQAREDQDATFKKHNSLWRLRRAARRILRRDS